MRIQYRHPKLYEFLVHKFLYSKGLWEKFQTEIGEGNTVFDVGAGYGYAARFVHHSNQYYGIDLNDVFVQYGRGNGVDLQKRDMFDQDAYKESDIFVVIDIIHHVAPQRLKDLFDMIFVHCKGKVIVIDPAFVSVTRRYGIFGRLIGWIFRILDDDGFNRIESWLSEEEYQKLFQSRFSSEYGKSFEMNRQKVGGHYFVVYTKV